MSDKLRKPRETQTEAYHVRIAFGQYVCFRSVGRLLSVREAKRLHTWLGRAIAWLEEQTK